MQISKRTGAHFRTEYIDVRYLFTQERYEEKNSKWSTREPIACARMYLLNHFLLAYVKTDWNGGNSKHGGC